MKDFELMNHGSIVMVRPRTRRARSWVEDNVHLESWQWFGGAFACEPRFLEDLMAGFQQFIDDREV